jgi:hypothetical protein
MDSIDIYWISHFSIQNIGRKYAIVSVNKCSRTKEGSFKIIAITSAISIPFWMDL